MLAGLTEAKLSWSKNIKVRYFPDGKTEDLQFHLIPYLKKKSDNIITYIGINDSPYKTERFTCNELVSVKETIKKHHPNCRNIVISLPTRTDKKEVNNILRNYATFWNRKKGLSFFTRTFEHRIYQGRVCT